MTLVKMLAILGSMMSELTLVATLCRLRVCVLVMVLLLLVLLSAVPQVPMRLQWTKIDVGRSGKIILLANMLLLNLFLLSSIHLLRHHRFKMLSQNDGSEETMANVRKRVARRVIRISNGCLRMYLETSRITQRVPVLRRTAQALHGQYNLRRQVLRPVHRQESSMKITTRALLML
jgi:hypothetical protein